MVLSPLAGAAPPLAALPTRRLDASPVGTSGAPRFEVPKVIQTWLTLTPFCLQRLAVPTLVVAAECFCALLPRRKTNSNSNVRSSAPIVVLIPAHNEEQSIANAIEAIRSELGADIKAVVVADHGTDKTPDVVRALGINVIENRDPEPRGKGHALQLGARSLDRDPPDVVIVIDADCIVAPGSIGLIAL